MHKSIIRNCKFYAEFPASPDCPSDNQCMKITKSGLLVSVHSVASHPEGNMEFHAIKEMHLPLSSMIKDSSWSGATNYNNIDFYGFKAKTEDGEKQVLIKLNGKASDYIQMQEFENLRFHDCEVGAMTWFFDPPDSWANPADCGDFPCTGPKNTVMHFKGTEWIGEDAGTVAAREKFGADF